jgi:hypothetical protein
MLNKTSVSRTELEREEFFRELEQELWYMDLDDLCCAGCGNVMDSPFEEGEEVCGIDKLKRRITPDAWCKEWKARWLG